MLILFQEVPGCATCQNYGLRVLSHPLLAEAVEDHFIPLTIFNNREGADKKILNAFGEPSWNNPVVRIIDKNEKELTRRLAGDYSPGGFSGSLIEALKAANKEVPPYLSAIHTEFSAGGLEETAYLSMFCFWQGEVGLGGIGGVIATRSGFIQGREIVEVTYNHQVLTYAELLKEARRYDCTDRVYPVDAGQRKTALQLLENSRVKELKEFREDSTLKYYLSKSPYRFVPLTLYQQVLVNRALHDGENPRQYLSPQQIDFFHHVNRNKSRVWENYIGSDTFTEDYGKMVDLLS